MVYFLHTKKERKHVGRVELGRVVLRLKTKICFIHQPPTQYSALFVHKLTDTNNIVTVYIN